jgi:sulfatase modifying factor 1
MPSVETRKPAALTSFWAGLPAAVEAAPARGELALRPPLQGRVAVPGGSFVMGSSPEDLRRAESLCSKEQLGAQCDDDRAKFLFLAEAPAHEVTLSPYEIDRTEVTVAAYARCVAAQACTPPTEGASDPRFNRPEFPVTNVDWDAAAAFCTWASGRLPTEAEWEFAARGSERREFPWGNVYNPYLANHGAYAADSSDATDGFVGLAPVGSFVDGATPLGLLDLAGNVSEWVSDFITRDAQGFGYDEASQVNPKGRPGGLHALRGGDYLQGAAWLRASFRTDGLGPSPTVGFRCAADVK